MRSAAPSCKPPSASASATDIREALEGSECELPRGFSVEVRTAEAGLHAFDIEYSVQPVKTEAAARAAATGRVIVVKGKTGTPSTRWKGPRTNIGRLAELTDADHRVVRRNDVVFEEGADEANATVSRKHAHIRLDAGDYRLCDDGSEFGTRVFRDGRSIEVPAGDRRGEKLRPGDEIYLGRACLRFEQVNDPYRSVPRRQRSSNSAFIASPMPSCRNTTAVQVGRVITGSSSASMPFCPSNTASFMGSDSAMRTCTPLATYSTSRCRWAVSSDADSSSSRHATPLWPACFTSFSSSGSTAYGGRENSRYSCFTSISMRRYSAAGLRRFGHNAQEVQRAASALAFGVERLQVVDQSAAGAAVVGEFLFQDLPFAGQVSGNRQAGLHRREELRLLLDHLGESLLHQAVQYFIDFLPRHVRPRRQFQRLELRMAQQHEVRPRLVSIEPKLLQASPKPLKINFAQFFAHTPQPYQSRAPFR